MQKLKAVSPERELSARRIEQAAELLEIKATAITQKPLVNRDK
jgi:hypothetical protein